MLHVNIMHIQKLISNLLGYLSCSPDILKRKNTICRTQECVVLASVIVAVRRVGGGGGWCRKAEIVGSIVLWT